MNRCVKILQMYSKCYISILSGHFDGPLSITSATKESKQQNKKKTKRKQKAGTHAYRKYKGKQILYKQI